MKTQLIYLSRHGETDANKKNIYQGMNMDEPLNTTGVAQAYALGLHLKSQGVDVARIYTSPTARTRQTAAIVAHILENGRKSASGFKLPEMFIEPDLYEINHGEWDGKTSDEVKILWPDITELWQNGDQMIVKFPGGESVPEARYRILAAFKKILNSTEENIVVVGHGGVNALFISSLLNSYVFRPIRQTNTCLNIIERHIDANGAQFKIVLINGASHLTSEALQ